MPLRIGRTCTATGAPSIVPSHTGAPNHHDEASVDRRRLLAFAVAAERHGNRPVEPARHGHLHPLLAELDDARLGEAHRLAMHLLGDGAASLIAHMIDGGGDRDQRIAHLADRAAAA